MLFAIGMLGCALLAAFPMVWGPRAVALAIVAALVVFPAYNAALRRSPQRVDLFADGTHARSTEGSYLTGAATDGSTPFVSWAGIDVRRIENRGDALGDRLLLEGTRVNALQWSEDFAQAVWAKTGVTITSNSSAAPDGAVDADTLSFTASATDQIEQTFTSADNHRATGSVYFRATAAQTLLLLILRRDGTESPAVTCNVPGTGIWTRFEIPSAPLLTGATVAKLIIRNGDAAARSVFAWGAQVEVGASSAGNFASSYIRTAGGVVTRGGDVLTIAQANVPAGFWTSGIAFRVSPLFLPVAMHQAIQGQCWIGGGGGAARFAFLSYNATSDPARLYVDNVNKSSAACSWATIDQDLRWAVSPSGGLVRLSGFTAGNGDTVLATWAPLASDMRIGADGAGSFISWGRWGQYIEAFS